MALPLLFFPAALLVTVTNLLVPELSDAHALGQRRQVARAGERAVDITVAAGIPIGCVFTVYGDVLGQLLYHDATVGLLLTLLGPLAPVMYLDTVATGLLRGLGEQVHSLWYAVADLIVRLVLIWLLLPRTVMCSAVWPRSPTAPWAKSHCRTASSCRCSRRSRC